MTLMRIAAVRQAALAAALAFAPGFVAGCAASPTQAPSGGGGGGGGGSQLPPVNGAGGSTDSGSGSGGSGGSPVPDAAPDDAVVQPEVNPQDAPPPGPDAGKPDGGAKPAPVPSAGCAAAAQLPEGAGTLPGGRRYVVHLPAGYQAGKPFPLVFALHPNGGNIGMFDDGTTRAAMRDWAILVLTQSETGDWRQAFPADLAYFDTLVALVKDKLCVDTGRIYSFGFSGGASFSNLLACQRTFLRAVGGGGGIPGYNGYTAPDCKPMPAWIDEGMRAGLLELWTAKDGCMQSMPGVRANCRQYVCSIAPVVYCTNGAHVWPSYGSGDVAAFFKQF